MRKIHRVRFELYIDVGADSREIALRIARDTAAAIRRDLPPNVKLGITAVVQR